MTDDFKYLRWFETDYFYVQKEICTSQRNERFNYAIRTLKINMTFFLVFFRSFGQFFTNFNVNISKFDLKVFKFYTFSRNNYASTYLNVNRKSFSLDPE